MTDEQTKLLVEIRDLTREHLELYRTHSTVGLRSQRRAMRSAWFIMIAVFLFVGVSYWVYAVWVGDQLERSRQLLESPAMFEDPAPDEPGESI